ncbi:MAG: hypothetical protein RR324_02360 [Cellulosilyticaceae bacterium]
MSSSHANSNQTTVIGNSMDIDIDPYHCHSEIRIDVTVSEFTSVRLWGQILNCNGMPVPNALVKLVKISGDSCDKNYKGIAHTTSDCEGFYQFDIYSDEHAWYKILVGKSNTGKEIIVSSSSHSTSTCLPDTPPNEHYPARYTPDLAPSNFGPPDFCPSEDATYATNQLRSYILPNENSPM